MAERVSQKVKENEMNVDYAYGVIDAVVQAMDVVATKPELSQAFIVDLLKKMPDIAEALIFMVKPEHRMKMYEFVKASTRMVGTWAQMER